MTAKRKQKRVPDFKHGMRLDDPIAESTKTQISVRGWTENDAMHEFKIMVDDYELKALQSCINKAINMRAKKISEHYTYMRANTPQMETP
jgi:hypothetical protein